ncbi:MAG: efflux RND transporter periplasmic adaptor subunit, partial [Chloroflexota bacterium]
QILSGLSSGAQVILPGSVELADGDAVLRAPAGPGPAPSTSAAPSSAPAQASASGQASAASSGK